MKTIKRIFHFFKYVIVAFSKTKKTKATFRAAFAILKEFGLGGFLKAIKNKAAGRNLLNGIIEPELDFEGLDVEFIVGDGVGRKILRKQQNEFSTDIIEKKANALQKQLNISIILFMKPGQVNLLKQTIQSIETQVYSKWEIWVLAAGMLDEERDNLFPVEAEMDTRINFEMIRQNMSIAQAYNNTVEKASGEYVLFINPGDQMERDALFWVADTLSNEEGIDLIFSDECSIDSNGIPYRFYFKPKWSPLLMMNSSYPGNFLIFGKNALVDAGGFDQEFDKCLIFEMALKISTLGRGIRHIERVLFSKYEIEETYIKNLHVSTEFTRALFNYMRSMNYPGIIYEHDNHHYVSKIRDVCSLTSIIIAVNENEAILKNLPQLLRDTAYPNFEIIIVADSKLLNQLTQLNLGMGKRITLCPCDDHANDSRKFNIGASVAAGEYLIFMFDDLCVAKCDWINQLVDVLDLPGIGAASPAVINPEGQAVYCGARIGQHEGGLYQTTFCGQSFYDHDNRALTPRMSREVSVLSKYCLSIRKEVFHAIGGFNEIDTPNQYRELEYSLRVIDNNLHCAYVPASTLIYEEPKMLKESYKQEKAYFYIIKKWNTTLEKDNLFSESMLQYSTNCADFSNRLYFPQKMTDGNNGNILLISHELSRTGSPQVVFQAAKVLKQAGYFPIVASPEDGPLAKDFIAEGITVIIDHTLAKYRAYRANEVPKGISPSFDNWLRLFDLVLTASIVSHNLINCYNGSKTRFLWWIHEGWMGFDLLKLYLPYNLKSNISVYCGGRYAQKMVKEYRPQYETDVLLYGVKDFYGAEDITCHRDKPLFLLPATFETRKNQMLLIEAVKMLPQELAEKADFLLLGKVGEEIYFRRLEREAKKLANVTVSGPVPYDKLMEIYRETTGVVIPSIDDPMPVVLAEAMMMSKVILCSDMTGTASYIEDGINGFVFSSKSASDLKDKLEHIIKNYYKMDEIRLAGRKTYEKYFSEDIFARNLIDIIEKNMNRIEEDA